MRAQASFIALCIVAFCTLVSAGVLEVNTPQLTQCKAGYLSWAGKYAPFNLTIINQKNGDALKTFGAVTGQNYSWTVDLPTGRNVALMIVDAKGNINYSNGVYIKNSSDSSCVSSAVDESRNATVTADAMPTVTGNTTARVSSGAIGANAAATTSADKDNSASQMTAVGGLGLLLACSIIALVA